MKKRILQMIEEAAVEGLEKVKAQKREKEMGPLWGWSQEKGITGPEALEELMGQDHHSRAWEETIRTLARYLDEASSEELVEIALETLPPGSLEMGTPGIPEKFFDAIEFTFSLDRENPLALSRGERFLMALVPLMWPRALRTLMVGETERGTVYAAARNLLVRAMYGTYLETHVEGFGEELKEVWKRWKGDLLLEPVLGRMIRFPWHMTKSAQGVYDRDRRKQVLVSSSEDPVKKVSWRVIQSIVTEGLRAAAKWMDHEHRANLLDCSTFRAGGIPWHAMNYLREAFPFDHPARIAFIRQVGKELDMEEDVDRRIALVNELGDGTTLYSLLDGLEELIKRDLIKPYEPGMWTLRALDRRVSPGYLERLLGSAAPEVVIAAVDGLCHYYSEIGDEGREAAEEALRRIAGTIDMRLEKVEDRKEVRLRLKALREKLEDWIYWIDRRKKARQALQI